MSKWSYWKVFKYAFNGLKVVFKGQRNFRIQVFMAFLVVIAGFLFSINTLEWMLIIFCIGSVLAFEIINTAIEEIVNFISPEYNEMAGKIKDLSAAAVLIVALFSVTIGMLIFIPKVVEFFLKC